MSFASDLSVLYHLLLKPVRGHDHAARMESFYEGQAGAYDRFRERLLQGREALWSGLTESLPADATWVDLGGGTGSNLELFGDAVHSLGQLHIVDLSPSLLAVAEGRIAERGVRQASTVLADAATYRPPGGGADVVTFSYSLTMIPDWFAAIDNAFDMLEDGGLIGVVDFYVARKHPPGGHRDHGWLTRTLWPTWFAADGVYLSPDHVPYLHRRFEVIRFEEHTARLPYLPGVRAPYYSFVGRKRRDERSDSSQLPASTASSS